VLQSINKRDKKRAFSRTFDLVEPMQNNIEKLCTVFHRKNSYICIVRLYIVLRNSKYITYLTL